MWREGRIIQGLRRFFHRTVQGLEKNRANTGARHEQKHGRHGRIKMWYKIQKIKNLLIYIGVIPIPEIKYNLLCPEDRFIVICSDGVWEFLQNKDVQDLVLPFLLKNNPEGACDKLVNESVAWWRREDEVIDDITAIVLFLK